MTKEKLYEALGGINEKYVIEAKEMKRHQKPGVFKWGIMAACLCLVMIGAFGYRLEHPYPIKKVVIQNRSEEATALVPRWEEMPIYQQYGEVVLKDTWYRAGAGEVSLEQLGAELATVTARGWDVYADGAGEDGNRYCNAKVYEISEIAAQCAVAIQYEGTDVYYAAINSSYRPETLGQFVEDLNLESLLVFNRMYYEYHKPISDAYTTICFDSVDSERVWEMLSAAPDAVNEHDDLYFLYFSRSAQKMLDISVDVPLLGYENISISVWEDGYIMTNILETGKLFYIGEENTQAFIDYALKECEGYEIVQIVDVQEMPE